MRVSVGWVARRVFGERAPRAPEHRPREIKSVGISTQSLPTPSGEGGEASESRSSIADSDVPVLRSRSQYDRWTPSEVRKLTINVIRHELMLEGMSSNGTKEELVSRLCEAKARIML